MSTETNSISQQTSLPFWRQFRWQLILYSVSLAVLPVMAVGYFTLVQVRTQTTNQVFQALDSAATLKENQLSLWLETGDLIFDAIKSNPSVRQQFVNLAQTGDTRDQAALDAYLAEAIVPDEGKDAYYTEIFFYDLQGSVLAASNAIDLGKVVSRQPYFSASLEEDYIQPPYYEVGSGNLTMIATEPIRDEDGNVVGVLAGRLDLTTLGDIMLERTGLGETGQTYLVSADNNYLLTPSLFEGYISTRAYHTEGIDRALSGQHGEGLYLGYRNIPVFGNYHWIPELNAALLAEIDEAEGLVLYAETAKLTTVLAVGSAVLAALFGLFIASRLSGSVVSLAQVATAIANGDLSKRAVIRQRNEIGLLAATFNQMTDQLANTIENLDQKVHEVEATNTALQVATAQAREAARLKSEFMSTMSHELRTPLNAILGFSGIMLQGMGGEMDDDALHMVERIDSNSQRLLKLINDILDLAKIEAGRMEMVKTPFSIRELAARWKAETGILAQRKGLTFDVSVDPALPDVLYGDSERITQITANLLSNAFKFTDQGKVTLSVALHAKSWSIQVSDTGAGIPPHALNYIFDEFRQVDGSTKRVYGGSGLGLAIVRNMCRMMNGTVNVTSELGKGSVFTVTLPLQTESQPELLETA